MRKINTNELKNLNINILVVGLGVTGVSVVDYFMKKKKKIIVVDNRDNPPFLNEIRAKYPSLEINLGNYEDKYFEWAQLLVMSPGVSLTTPQIDKAIKRGVAVIGDIELFLGEAKAPIVAITGSNGKSTVTTLVGDMAKTSGLNVAIGGNIGIPALSLLNENVEKYILELSSFQLETTHTLKAQVATVLNLQSDHLDRHVSFENYKKIKSKILKGAEIGIYNADDDEVLSLERTKKSYFFTLNEPKNEKFFGLRKFGNDEWLCKGTNRLISCKDLLIPGRHNLANCLAALAIGYGLELPKESMINALKSFPGLPHRTEFITKLNNISWYNDSKATNIGATQAALKGMHRGDSRRAVIILGGDCKNANFDELTLTLAECARAAVLIGQDAEKIKSSIPDSCKISIAKNMDDAVKKAALLAKPEDHILLSPACASFDMFSNFSERGNAFKDSVRRLIS